MYKSLHNPRVISYTDGILFIFGIQCISYVDNTKVLYPQTSHMKMDQVVDLMRMNTILTAQRINQLAVSELRKHIKTWVSNPRKIVDIGIYLEHGTSIASHESLIFCADIEKELILEISIERKIMCLEASIIRQIKVRAGRRSPEIACWASDQLVRTHSGASFVINFASLSPASAWPSLA